MVVYEGNYLVIDAAVKIVNDPKFRRALIAEIKGKDYFDMSTASSDTIADELKAFIQTTNITVKVYTPWWRWSKAVAKFEPSTPFAIYLNSRQLLRSVESVVGSIIHEMIHCMDYHDIAFSYGHGNNSPKGKENTAPYWIGRKAKELV